MEPLHWEADVLSQTTFPNAPRSAATMPPVQLWGGRILLQRTSSPYFAVALSSSGGDGGAVVVGDRSVGGRGRKESSAITEDLPRELQQMLQKECVAAVSHTGTFVAFCTTSNRPVCCLYDVVHNSCHVIGSVPFREGPVSTDQKDGVRCVAPLCCIPRCSSSHSTNVNRSPVVSESTHQADRQHLFDSPVGMYSLQDSFSLRTKAEQQEGSGAALQLWVANHGESVLIRFSVDQEILCCWSKESGQWSRCTLDSVNQKAYANAAFSHHEGAGLCWSLAFIWAIGVRNEDLVSVDVASSLRGDESVCHAVLHAEVMCLGFSDVKTRISEHPCKGSFLGVALLRNCPGNELASDMGLHSCWNLRGDSLFLCFSSVLGGIGVLNTLSSQENVHVDQDRRLPRSPSSDFSFQGHPTSSTSRAFGILLDIHLDGWGMSKFSEQALRSGDTHGPRDLRLTLDLRPVCFHGLFSGQDLVVASVWLFQDSALALLSSRGRVVMLSGVGHYLGELEHHHSLASLLNTDVDTTFASSVSTVDQSSGSLEEEVPLHIGDLNVCLFSSSGHGRVLQSDGRPCDYSSALLGVLHRPSFSSFTLRLRFHHRQWDALAMDSEWERLFDESAHRVFCNPKLAFLEYHTDLDDATLPWGMPFPLEVQHFESCTRSLWSELLVERPVVATLRPDRVSHLKSLWALYFRLLDTAPLARSIPMWTSCVGSSLIHFTLETEWGGGFREEFREVLQFVAKCWSRMQHVHYGLQVLLDLIRTSSLVVFRDTSDVQDVRQFLLGCSYILCTVVFADPSMDLDPIVSLFHFVRCSHDCQSGSIPFQQLPQHLRRQLRFEKDRVYDRWLSGYFSWILSSGDILSAIDLTLSQLSLDCSSTSDRSSSPSLLLHLCMEEDSRFSVGLTQHPESRCIVTTMARILTLFLLGVRNPSHAIIPPIECMQTVKPLNNLALLVGHNAHGRGRRLMSTLLRQAQHTTLHVLPQLSRPFLNVGLWSILGQPLEVFRLLLHFCLWTEAKETLGSLDFQVEDLHGLTKLFTSYICQNIHAGDIFAVYKCVLLVKNSPCPKEMAEQVFQTVILECLQFVRRRISKLCLFEYHQMVESQENADSFIVEKLMLGMSFFCRMEGVPFEEMKFSEMDAIVGEIRDSGIRTCLPSLALCFFTALPVTPTIIQHLMSDADSPSQHSPSIVDPSMVQPVRVLLRLVFALRHRIRLGSLVEHLSQSRCGSLRAMCCWESIARKHSSIFFQDEKWRELVSATGVTLDFVDLFGAEFVHDFSVWAFAMAVSKMPHLCSSVDRHLMKHLSSVSLVQPRTRMAYRQLVEDLSSLKQQEIPPPSPDSARRTVSGSSLLSSADIHPGLESPLRHHGKLTVGHFTMATEMSWFFETSSMYQAFLEVLDAQLTHLKRAFAPSQDFPFYANKLQCALLQCGDSEQSPLSSRHSKPHPILITSGLTPTLPPVKSISELLRCMVVRQLIVRNFAPCDPLQHDGDDVDEDGEDILRLSALRLELDGSSTASSPSNVAAKHTATLKEELEGEEAEDQEEVDSVRVGSPSYWEDDEEELCSGGRPNSYDPSAAFPVLFGDVSEEDEEEEEEEGGSMISVVTATTASCSQMDKELVSVRSQSTSSADGGRLSGPALLMMSPESGEIPAWNPHQRPFSRSSFASEVSDGKGGPQAIADPPTCKGNVAEPMAEAGSKKGEGEIAGHQFNFEAGGGNLLYDPVADCFIQTQGVVPSTSSATASRDSGGDGVSLGDEDLPALPMYLPVPWPPQSSLLGQRETNPNPSPCPPLPLHPSTRDSPSSFSSVPGMWPGVGSVGAAPRFPWDPPRSHGWNQQQAPISGPPLLPVYTAHTPPPPAPWDGYSPLSYMQHGASHHDIAPPYVPHPNPYFVSRPSPFQESLIPPFIPAVDGQEGNQKGVQRVEQRRFPPPDVYRPELDPENSSSRFCSEDAVQVSTDDIIVPPRYGEGLSHPPPVAVEEVDVQQHQDSSKMSAEVSGLREMMREILDRLAAGDGVRCPPPAVKDTDTCTSPVQRADIALSARSHEEESAIRLATPPVSHREPAPTVGVPLGLLTSSREWKCVTSLTADHENVPPSMRALHSRPSAAHLANSRGDESVHHPASFLLPPASTLAPAPVEDRTRTPSPRLESTSPKQGLESNGNKQVSSPRSDFEWPPLDGSLDTRRLFKRMQLESTHDRVSTLCQLIDHVTRDTEQLGDSQGRIIAELEAELRDSLQVPQDTRPSREECASGHLHHDPFSPTTQSRIPETSHGTGSAAVGGTTLLRVLEYTPVNDLPLPERRVSPPPPPPPGSGTPFSLFPQRQVPPLPVSGVTVQSMGAESWRRQSSPATRASGRSPRLAHSPPSRDGGSRNPVRSPNPLGREHSTNPPASSRRGKQALPGTRRRPKGDNTLEGIQGDMNALLHELEFMMVQSGQRKQL